MSYALIDELPIISSTMRLLNLAIGEDGQQTPISARYAHESELKNAAFERWCKTLAR
eukprot:IDg10490t1